MRTTTTEMREYTQWSDHWTNGGTGIAKLSGDSLSQISESIEAFGDKSIFIKSDGGAGYEMHFTRDKIDLSDFWEFHRERTGKP